MNDRQRTLAAYLLQAKGYVSQKQIMADLPDYTSERTIRADVRQLNSGSFSYIIVSSDDGYSIASEDEAKAYLERKRKTALRMLELYHKVQRKLQNNGQLKANNADNIVEVQTVCAK